MMEAGSLTAHLQVFCVYCLSVLCSCLSVLTELYVHLYTYIVAFITGAHAFCIYRQLGNVQTLFLALSQQLLGTLGISMSCQAGALTEAMLL